MANLEDLQPGAAVRRVLPDSLATVVTVQWHGSNAVTLIYKDPQGRLANEILYRHDEPRENTAEVGRPWSFDGYGALFRLLAEAQRIHLALLFDQILSVQPSQMAQVEAIGESLL